MKKVSDTTASLNGEVTFTIEFDGNPVPEIKWLRNGMELGSAGRYRIQTKDSKSSLTFMEAWDSDNNSKISCELVNPLGRDSCEAVLHVRSK